MASEGDYLITMGKLFGPRETTKCRTMYEAFRIAEQFGFSKDSFSIAQDIEGNEEYVSARGVNMFFIRSLDPEKEKSK